VTEHQLTDYLDHICAAIDRILEYTSGLTQDEFAQDTRTQDAVIRNIEIIGEASNRIRTEYPAFAGAHPELPLAAAYQMRNAVAHGYFEVDVGVVWKTVLNDVPRLRGMIIDYVERK
jgi:uncharacterized protein with HEPN domain